MKKFLISIIFTIIICPFLNINALSSDEVDYEVTNYYVQSDIDIAGSLNVKELIVVDGAFNGYIRDIKWKNEELDKFSGKDSDFYGSDIYNASGITNLKVGTVKLSDTVVFDDLFNKVTYSKKEKNVSNGSKNKYELTKDKTGVSIKMFNLNTSGKVGFYLEYTITNVSVKHKDVAEFYYNFIGKNFDDNIGQLEIRTFFPEEASDDYKIWAHGPLNGTIAKIKGNLGSVLKCSNLHKNTPVDVRMTYDLDLYPISLHKNTEINALDKIVKVEEERALDANKKRQAAKVVLMSVNLTSIIYIILLIIIAVFIYIKYDKELKSNFKNKYYREIIEDYPVEVVEYLMEHKITSKALSASILNLIYKKNIEVVETKNKKDYIFTLINKKKLSSSEKILVELLFDVVGENNQFTLKELKKESKKNSLTFYETYESWKSSVESDCYEQHFYFEENKFKVIGVLYGIIGILLFILNFVFEVNSIVPVIAFITTIIFLIYIFTLRKRTEKGNDDYYKWKAFKNFLNDFGRFDEKELPEIKLWERLLVYATVFGIATEVQKAMKLKLNQINPNYMNTYNDTMFDYLLFTNLSSNINTSVANALTTAEIANSTASSGTGNGGGFSSGAGFGGGGGGGRGF